MADLLDSAAKVLLATAPGGLVRLAFPGRDVVVKRQDESELPAVRRQVDGVFELDVPGTGDSRTDEAVATPSAADYARGAPRIGGRPMRRVAFLLALFAAPALAQQQPSPVDQLHPREVLRILRGGGDAAVQADVTTLEQVLELTGHSRAQVEQLLRLQGESTRAPDLVAGDDVKVVAVSATTPPGARAWNDLPSGVTLRAVYTGGDMEISVVREDTSGSLAVFVPPGLVGSVDRSDGERSAQDLAILGAATLELEVGQAEASVALPVACASYGWRGPSSGMRYVLREAEGDFGRLVRRLAADGISGPPAALAVWAVRDRIATGRWCDMSTMQGEGVDPEHGPAAARLIRESGLDPATLPLWGAEVKAPEEPVGKP